MSGKSRRRGDKRGPRHMLVLGRVLYLARKDAGLSQHELARRLDIPQNGVSKLESGKTTLAVWHIDCIGKIIGVPGHKLHRAGTEIARVVLPTKAEGEALMALVDALWPWPDEPAPTRASPRAGG